MANDPRHVAEAIEKANQTAIAKNVGVSRNFVCMVFGQKKVPSLPVAQKMSRELGVTLDAFSRFVLERAA